MNIEMLENSILSVPMMRIKRAIGMSGKWIDQEHVFTYIASGKAEFIVRGRQFILEQGDLIVMPPYSPHVIVAQGKEQLVQYIFHFNCISPSGEVMYIDDSNIFTATISDNERIELSNNYLRMYKEFREKKVGYKLILQGLGMAILATYFRNDSSVKDMVSVSRAHKSKSWIHIEDAIEYINRHYRDYNLDNRTISNAIGVSPNHLTVLFQKFLGMSLHTYVLNIKIEKAKKKLLSGKVNITEAALSSGFQSIHSFSKIFKNINGMTPSEFMENSVNKDKFASRYGDEIGTNGEGIFYKG